MKYLGVVKRSNATLTLPDGFQQAVQSGEYEAIEVGGDILLLASPLDRSRLKRVEKLAKQSIDEHRRTLEGLAQ
jgi:hypothetical protein